MFGIQEFCKGLDKGTRAKKWPYELDTLHGEYLNGQEEEPLDTRLGHLVNQGTGGTYEEADTSSEEGSLQGTEAEKEGEADFSVTAEPI